MKILGIWNRITGKRRAMRVDSWKRAHDVSRLLGVAESIHSDDTLDGYLDRVVKNLQSDPHMLAEVADIRHSPCHADIVKHLFSKHGHIAVDETQRLQKSDIEHPEEKSMGDRIAQQLEKEGSIQDAEKMSALHKNLRSVGLYLRGDKYDPENLPNLIKGHHPAAMTMPHEHVKAVADSLVAEHSPESNELTLHAAEHSPRWDKDLQTNAPISWLNCLQAYKTDPHASLPANLLKYVVHRVVKADQYDHDPAGMDKDFVDNGAKDMNQYGLAMLKMRLAQNPHLVAQALATKRQHVQKITEFSPHLIRETDAGPSVTLARALFTDQHGPDLTVASYADTANPGMGVFGHNVHGYDVPLQHIWAHYELSPASKEQSFGGENEVLVDRWHPRNKTYPSGATPLVPEGAYDYELDQLPARLLVRHAFTANHGIDLLNSEDVRNSVKKYFGGIPYDRSKYFPDTKAARSAFFSKHLTPEERLEIANPSRYDPDMPTLSEFQDGLTDEQKKAWVGSLASRIKSFGNGYETNPHATIHMVNKLADAIGQHAQHIPSETIPPLVERLLQWRERAEQKNDTRYRDTFTALLLGLGQARPQEFADALRAQGLSPAHVEDFKHNMLGESTVFDHYGHKMLQKYGLSTRTNL